MLRSLLLIIIWLSASATIAQEKRIKLGAQLTPGLSIGFVNKTDSNSTYFGSATSARLSYSLGFGLDISFNPGWGMFSGLNFQQVGDKSEIFPPDTSRGLIHSRYYKSSSYSLEVPLEIYRNFGESWFACLGSSFLFNFYDEVRIISGGSKGLKLNSEEYRGTRLCGSINLGFGYQRILRRGTIRIYPYSQLGFIEPMNSFSIFDFLPRRKYYSIGLKFTYMI